MSCDSEDYALRSVLFFQVYRGPINGICLMGSDIFLGQLIDIRNVLMWIRGETTCSYKKPLVFGLLLGLAEEIKVPLSC